MRNNNKGFTLIELIMVTIILGILAAVAVPRYMGTVNRAEAAAEDAVLSALKANAEGYALEKFMDVGRKSYPANPFTGASVDGYLNAQGAGKTAVVASGDWALVIASNVKKITHMRNDNSVQTWLYSSADQSTEHADDRGSFGARVTLSAQSGDSTGDSSE